MGATPCRVVSAVANRGSQADKQTLQLADFWHSANAVRWKSDGRPGLFCCAIWRSVQWSIAQPALYFDSRRRLESGRANCSGAMGTPTVTSVLGRPTGLLAGLGESLWDSNTAQTQNGCHHVNQPQSL